ncbi:MAG: PAS domain-containing protein [Saccharofermentans sp.]|nr:PAS domain-containing protein [Saccharofermentans sp.]
MFGRNFVLNEETMGIIHQIGRHMPGGFFIYKAEGDEEIIYANDATVSLFGCADIEDFKAHTGNTFKGMLHPDDYAAVTNSVNDQIRMSSENMDHVEYRIIRKDGAVRWVDDYGHYTQTDNYGGIYYVFIADITEQHDLKERSNLKEQLISEQVRREEQDKMITALAGTDAATIPIIAMTANAFDEDVQRSLQSGMNAHLTKPVEPDRLYQTLEELIWESEQTDG